jgi:hypothetical protein
MTLSTWKLLGFDARENELAGRNTPIPPKIREVMLLRPEIESPYSVDRHIWPTQFLYFPHTRTYTRVPPLIETDKESEYDFWPNLTQMQRSLAENGRQAILIAVQMLAPENITFSKYVPPNIHLKTDPKSIPDGSICLGFDVADSGFWSGLSNCGYSEEERKRLRPEWQSKINDFGLLQTEQDALIFREMTDIRVPEHAPFWVYKLYRLQES